MIAFLLIESSAFANEVIDEQNIPLQGNILLEKQSIILEDGAEFIFDNESDFQSYTSKLNKRTPWYTYTSKTLEHKVLKKVFAGYCPETPSWSKASQYTTGTTKNYTLSFGFDFGGSRMNYSDSFSWAVSTTIPANQSKHSRLAFYADYDCKKQGIMNANLWLESLSVAIFMGN